MGLLSFHFNQDDHAVEWISRAIQQDPKPQYLFTLGVTRQRQRRFEGHRAEEGLEALEVRPVARVADERLGGRLAQHVRDQAQGAMHVLVRDRLQPGEQRPRELFAG